MLQYGHVNLPREGRVEVGERMPETTQQNVAESVSVFLDSMYFAESIRFLFVRWRGPGAASELGRPPANQESVTYVPYKRPIAP